MPGTRARSALAGSRFADVRWVPETASTNADVLALARQGEPEGIVVVADHQSSGRGRQGRRWTAPAGSSLLVTVLLRPVPALTGLVTMAGGIAAAEAVEDVAGFAPRLKWPNDLVWPGDGRGDDRKLAGLLSEADWPPGVTADGGWSAPPADQRVAVALGMGLNVHWPPDMTTVLSVEDAVELAGRSVAISDVISREVDRVDLLVAWLRRLEARYDDLGASRDPGPLVEEWRRRSATLGRRVRVDLGRDEIQGTAVDVAPDGALIVETAPGVRRTIAVGDVVHLRNA